MRRCKKCNKILAELNSSDLCFKHIYDDKKLSKLLETFNCFHLGTVCSSRVTTGFNRVCIDYYGRPE